MGFLDKYNKKPLFEYDKDKEREYIKLEGLVNHFGIMKVYDVHALFINTKSRYGDEPIIVTDEYLVNAPHHLLETVKEMLADRDLINMINNRKVGFTIYGYNGKKGYGYSVEWVEK